MNRDEKAQAIEEITADIESAESIFAVDYRGISVTQAAELRGKLREADASFRVVKNRLTKIAAEKAGEERLAELLEGPTALTFVRGDTAMAAKAISTFNKEHEVVSFKGGFMEDVSLDEEKFKSIARLPGRDVLNGQFAGVVASPLTGLVRGLGSMIQGLALQLGQIAEKGLVTGEAPSDGGAGPAAEEDSSSSQAAGEEPSSTSPAPDAGAQDGDDSQGDAGPADAPAEQEPTESGAAAETPAADDPSQAEGDEGDAEPAGDEGGSDSGGGDETSESDDDDSSKEEE
jgi:large subunit ribosomal protein L10